MDWNCGMYTCQQLKHTTITHTHTYSTDCTQTNPIWHLSSSGHSTTGYYYCTKLFYTHDNTVNINIICTLFQEIHNYNNNNKSGKIKAYFLKCKDKINITSRTGSGRSREWSIEVLKDCIPCRLMRINCTAAVQELTEEMMPQHRQ